MIFQLQEDEIYENLLHYYKKEQKHDFYPKKNFLKKIKKINKNRNFNSQFARNGKKMHSADRGNFI